MTGKSLVTTLMRIWAMSKMIEWISNLCPIKWELTHFIILLPTKCHSDKLQDSSMLLTRLSDKLLSNIPKLKEPISWWTFQWRLNYSRIDWKRSKLSTKESLDKKWEKFSRTFTMMQSQTILLHSDHAIKAAIWRFLKINRPDKEESLTNLIFKSKRTNQKALKMSICTLITRMKVLMISMIQTSKFYRPYHLTSSPPKLDLMS